MTHIQNNVSVTNNNIAMQMEVAETQLQQELELFEMRGLSPFNLACLGRPWVVIAGQTLILLFVFPCCDMGSDFPGF